MWTSLVKKLATAAVLHIYTAYENHQMTRSDTRDHLLYLKPWPLASYSFAGQTLTWGVWPVRL